MPQPRRWSAFRASAFCSCSCRRSSPGPRRVVGDERKGSCFHPLPSRLVACDPEILEFRCPCFRRGALLQPNERGGDDDVSTRGGDDEAPHLFAMLCWKGARMINATSGDDLPPPPPGCLRDVPVDWEALE